MNHPLITTPDFGAARSLDELYGMLDHIQVKNGWNKPTPSLYPQPKQYFVPAHWRYVDAHAALAAAGRLIGTDKAERRNLILANPIAGNDYPTVTSLVAAYQMVKSGEVARSHRHTPNAMRIVVDAQPRMYTTVNGANVPMLPGDVLLTPNWSYHGHDNQSGSDAYWIDILDAPLVQLLGPMFFEPHPDGVERAQGVDERSPMRFAFADYAAKLQKSAEVAPGVRTFELGPPTLHTFDRVAVSLDEKTDWACPRTTANQIYVVVQGEGSSTIGERRFAWARGDVFAAPSWIAQRHLARSPSILMRMSDAPVMKAFAWLRAESASA